jgi:hypothetical protein
MGKFFFEKTRAISHYLNYFRQNPSQPLLHQIGPRLRLAQHALLHQVDEVLRPPADARLPYERARPKIGQA